jgi:signal-transduction protein with cAMP-binding, CBS, and nucleotidyltransferase domain
VARCLNYEFFKKGENVFDWGNPGDKFYIILKGTVSVQVPTEKLKNKINGLMQDELLRLLNRTVKEQ